VTNLDTQLAQLETAQLVRRANDAEAAFQFKHTLTQETVYQSLLRAKRREIHA
jgi:predicted ATPase